ncbi:threonine/serine ThrE exporter family protein [Clostridium weizhouense]|uniref:Threonine/serine exporter family protein n=1 Tax=Clostridium weizhouense TaxID=2859781 RepID=A0ABS7AMK7_9CLOT|nr:threonine/serine exporter family protein [Clostridium weizhouense]MBW6409893.1 threonine/serine exporter family protein [Clostridium weizhouense]
MDLNKLLQISTFAGKIMIESGAETYRVEETICRICTSFGVDEADSFVTPTGVMVSVTHKNQVLTLVKRVTSRGVDLNKIDKINTLSRRTQTNKMTLDDFNKELIKIAKGDRYSNFFTLIWSGISAGSFAILFGGNYKDFFAATLIGLIIKIIFIKCENLNLNEFFINCLCGGVCALLTIILIKFNLNNNLDKTIIGSLMLLVPGLTITNAIRDTIAGDFLAGITKISEAFLVAVSIAVGSGAVLSIFINKLGGI